MLGVLTLRRLCFWCQKTEDLYNKSQVEIKSTIWIHSNNLPNITVGSFDVIGDC